MSVDFQTTFPQKSTRVTRSINIEGGKRLATLAKQAGFRRYVYQFELVRLRSGDQAEFHRDRRLPSPNAIRPQQGRGGGPSALDRGDGFEPVILRNATVFGVAPRMRFDLAVNVMTLRAWSDGVIYVMGGGEQWRPFIHVDDVVRAFVWAVELNNAAGETFNVGTSNHTIAEVSKKVAAEFPMARIMPIPDDPDKRSYSCSFEKIEKASAFNRRLTGDRLYALNHAIDHPVLIQNEISRMAKMLREGSLKDLPETYTLQFYRSLIEWENRLNSIRLDGKIL